MAATPSHEHIARPSSMTHCLATATPRSLSALVRYGWCSFHRCCSSISVVVVVGVIARRRLDFDNVLYRYARWWPHDDATNIARCCQNREEYLPRARNGRARQNNRRPVIEDGRKVQHLHLPAIVRLPTPQHAVMMTMMMCVTRVQCSVMSPPRQNRQPCAHARHQMLGGKLVRMNS